MHWIFLRLDVLVSLLLTFSFKLFSPIIRKSQRIPGVTYIIVTIWKYAFSANFNTYLKETWLFRSDACKECRSPGATRAEQVDWSESNVLEYMKSIYARQAISFDESGIYMPARIGHAPYNPRTHSNDVHNGGNVGGSAKSGARSVFSKVDLFLALLVYSCIAAIFAFFYIIFFVRGRRSRTRTILFWLTCSLCPKKAHLYWSQNQ